MFNQTHYRTCNLCEAMCGIEIAHDGTRVTSIKPDKADPFSQGHICPKAVALKDIQEDPDRLKTPMKREGDQWEEVSWEQAFDEIETKLNGLVNKYGNDSIGMYSGNPTVHKYSSLLFHKNLIDALKSKNVFSATSVDQLPHHMASQFQFGHSLLIPIPDVDRTDFMILMGANPMASNGSLMSAPGIGNRLKKIQARGGKVIVIDPRHTETANIADHHISISPGDDVYLLLSLLHVIFERGWFDLKGLKQHVNHLDKIKTAVIPFTPKLIERKTGIAEETLVELAHDFAHAEKAVCYGRLGLSTQVHGGLCQWLINILNIVTGNFDREGGAMFTTPAVDVLMGSNPKKQYARWHSRVRGFPEFKGELPVSVLSEEILTKGPGQIKGMITLAGNPVLSTPNGRKLERALSELEFMVCIDPYINETTRHAKIILPPPTALESDNFDLIFNALAVRNTAKYSPALFKSDGMKEWEILKELGKRISGKSSLFQKLLTPKRLLDLALKVGPYGAWRNLFSPGSKRLSLKKLERQVHGIDLGPLKPQIPKILRTASKKIEMAPSIYLDRLSAVAKNLVSKPDAMPKGSFLLIGRRQVRNNNSWMHNSKTLIKGKNRCTLLMNPIDAQDSELVSENWVRVKSNIGEVSLPVEVTDDMMQGVVSIPHGFGHNREGTRISLAEQNPGESINDLTDDRVIDELTGNAAFSGQRVEIFHEETPNEPANK